MTSTPAGDGVGYVGLLLQRALIDLWGDVRLVALDAARPSRIGRWEAARFAWRLWRAQLRPPPVPLLFNHLGIARAQRLLPRRLRPPYAVFLHGVEIWDPQLDAERQRVVRDAAIRFSNSRYTASRVLQTHPGIGAVVPCPLALLPDEPEPTSEAVAAAARALPPGPRVVIVGRMSASERYKGHDELLESWPIVRQAVPQASLLMVGRGDDVPRLQARALALGVGASVHFTGFLDDLAMRATLAASDVFVMPSSGEGFGLAYLEAMRAGLPCIGSDADAAGDVVENGRTGLVVPARDPLALSTALVTVLLDEPLRRRMGEQGRIRERTTFSFASFRKTLGTELAHVARTLQS